MTKLFCIKETDYLTLHGKHGCLYIGPICIGDFIEIDRDMIYFKEAGETYAGSISPDSNNFYGPYHNEPILKECFVSVAEWRENQINSILND